MFLEKARNADIPALTDLINRGYRGESSRAGWTTEADLLTGLRIDQSGLRELLYDPDSLLLVAHEDNTIVASIHAHREPDGVHFGLFAVEPSIQGNGIGKKLLKHAEEHARKEWNVNAAFMEVITQRSELIAFYGRQGYVPTGEQIPFPENPLWTRSVSFLEMAVLKKTLS